MVRRQQVIEISPPPPIEATEHEVYHGWCAQRGKGREAPLEVSTEVMGQARFGVKLTSVIAWLRTVMRLPVRQIQACLEILHRLQLLTASRCDSSGTSRCR